MMYNKRRKTGRFGIGQAATSVAAVAILAVSPAVASLADSRLDGIALTVAEAVFGEPVCAQMGDCLDRHGNPRKCTATEEASQCLLDAQDAFQQCIDETPWYLEFLCWAALAADTAACAVDYVGDFIPL